MANRVPQVHMLYMVTETEIEHFPTIKYAKKLYVNRAVCLNT